MVTATRTILSAESKHYDYCYQGSLSQTAESKHYDYCYQGSLSRTRMRNLTYNTIIMVCARMHVGVCECVCVCTHCDGLYLNVFAVPNKLLPTFQ